MLLSDGDESARHTRRWQGTTIVRMLSATPGFRGTDGVDAVGACVVQSHVASQVDHACIFRLQKIIPTLAVCAECATDKQAS